MNFHSNNIKSGITLTEIIFATMIMALAILPIVGIFSQGHKLSQKDMRRIEAINIAQSTMNKLLKIPYLLVPTGTKTATFATASGTVELGTINGSNTNKYSVKLIVSDYPVTFSYHPVDLNDSGYKSDESQTWKFLSKTTAGSKFDGSSAKNPIMIKKYEINVTWLTPNSIQPPSVNIITLKANLNE